MVVLLAACINETTPDPTATASSTEEADQPRGNPTISLTEVIQTAEALGFAPTARSSPIQAPSATPPSSLTLAPMPSLTPIPPTATHVPSPPTETLIPPPSPEYLNPEGSFLRAYEHVFGQPIPQLFIEHGILLDAQWHPGLFHLASVPVGKFNRDTTGYYDWLIQFVRWKYGTDPTSEFDFEGHARDQFLSVVFDSSSEVAQVLAGVAAELGVATVDDQLAFYMRYLYMPTQLVYWSSWNSSHSMRRVWEIRLQDMRINFASAWHDGPNGASDFPSFLRLNPDYFPFGLEDIGTPEQASTPPTLPATDDSHIPPDGAILYDRPLTEWFEEDTEEGWFAVEGGTFHIGMYLGEGRTRETWTSDDGFGDISASVNVRQVSSNTNSGGCLAVRQHVDEGECQLCILNNGHTWATYDYVDSSGTWHSEELLPAVERTGVHPSSAWNELKIVARGNELSFLANGQLIGSITHDGRTSGHAAIQVTNWGTDTVEWEFDSLIVRAVE